MAIQNGNDERGQRWQVYTPDGTARQSFGAARAGWSYRFTRGNRGYAMFPPQSQDLAACSPAIEMHAPSGRVCGTVTLRVSGDACRTGSLDQGWDGTVVAQAAEGSCHFRWWPRLLAGD